MNLRTLLRPRTRTSAPTTGAHRRPPAPSRRPALLLSTAAAGALLVNVLAAGEPAEAESQLASVSIAEQLGISADSAPSGTEAVAPLEQLAASRAERDQQQAAAAAAQSEANQAELDARAALIAAREELARRQAEAEAAREEQARRAAEAEAAAAEAAESSASAPAPAAAPAGSYQEYALAQLGGNANEFSCLESLWGKESGWNPDAQNPTSTAYGIPQFLDSTWAGTGIAKTSDGYRQIDAGLIYIENRYGSPCGAWSHSQANNWY